ncbi:hypothetical protein Dimus_023540 [Dionaea muscipula]
MNQIARILPDFHVQLHRLAIVIITISSLVADLLIQPSHADVGTASAYSPPYVPNACYGYDVSLFPSDNLIAAAGNGIWDNGAACGRQYLVRCISSEVAGGCVEGATVEISIVDVAAAAAAAATTMVLSNTAFGMIANPSLTNDGINIEFQQV